MHALRRRATAALGLTAVVFLVIVAVSTVGRMPAAGELYAQTSWRGLVVAPEQPCSPYDADDYRYPPSVEDRIVAQPVAKVGEQPGPLGGPTSYTGTPCRWARKPAERQRSPLWVTTADLPTSAGHLFFERLNRVLDDAGFDAFVEGPCAVFYAARMGRVCVR